MKKVYVIFEEINNYNDIDILSYKITTTKAKAETIMINTFNAHNKKTYEKVKTTNNEIIAYNDIHENFYRVYIEEKEIEL